MCDLDIGPIEFCLGVGNDPVVRVMTFLSNALRNSLRLDPIG